MNSFPLRETLKSTVGPYKCSQTDDIDEHRGVEQIKLNVGKFSAVTFVSAQRGEIFFLS